MVLKFSWAEQLGSFTSMWCKNQRTLFISKVQRDSRPGGGYSCRNVLLSSVLLAVYTWPCPVCSWDTHVTQPLLLRSCAEPQWLRIVHWVLPKRRWPTLYIALKTNQTKSTSVALLMLWSHRCGIYCCLFTDGVILIGHCRLLVLSRKQVLRVKVGRTRVLLNWSLCFQITPSLKI